VVASTKYTVAFGTDAPPTGAADALGAFVADLAAESGPMSRTMRPLTAETLRGAAPVGAAESGMSPLV
jgi:hypothetical protein